jgi:hypothetical protein
MRSSRVSLPRIVAIAALATCVSCAARSRAITTPTGLRYEIVTAGTGPAAQAGRTSGSMRRRL